ncbi:MAG: response regulator [bacterium]|nr:response regulator [bacterium]
MERRSLLVAEPNDLQRQLIDMMVSVDDIEVVSVGSGQDALAYLRENTPNAMLFAAGLPDIDGFDLCQKVKAVSRLTQVPVVLVADPGDAGGLGEATRNRARAVGVELLLQRPLGDKNLRERIARLMQQAPPTDPGPTPALPAVDTAAAATPMAVGFSMAVGTGQAASELGSLRAEAAQLRTENAALKARVAKYKALAQNLQQQLDEERKKPRGLFGRCG